LKGISTSSGFAESIAARADGSFVLAGRGRPTGWTKRPPAKQTSAFVAALDASGAPAWSTELESPDATARSVIALPDGSTIACGDYKGTLRIRGTTVATAMGDADIFVVALGPDGKLKWRASAGGPGYDSCLDVAALPDGRIVAVGIVGPDAKFGVFPRSAKGDGDAFVAMLEAPGVVRWVETGGSAERDEARSVAVTADGIFVTGSFGGDASFGVRTFSLPRAAAKPTRLVANPSNAFVARYMLTGDVMWAAPLGTANSFDRGWAVTVLSDGDVVAVGDIEDGLFLARYTATGVSSWVRRSRGSSTARAVIGLPDGGLLVSAYFGWPQGGPDVELAGVARKLPLHAAGSATAVARYSGTGELLGAGLLSGEKPHGKIERSGTEVEIMDMARSPTGRIALAGRLQLGAGVVPGELFAPATARVVQPPGQDTTIAVVLDPAE
jgi:hypothetical protein